MVWPASSRRGIWENSRLSRPISCAIYPREFVPSRTFHTKSAEETVALGRTLGKDLHGVVLLIGNLGAGKTTLTKGIVEGRGVATVDTVSSPTFTLVHQYGEAEPV